jgi:diaminopimelate decarboxylase
VNGAEFSELAEEFGTPLYVYDLDQIERRAAALRQAMPEVVEIAYAVKANPSLAVLHRLAAQGLGADVASLGELEAVLRAGFDPSRVIFTGPGKRDEELRRAVTCGLRAVTVESLGELERLEAVSTQLGRRAAVLLRMANQAVAGEDGVIGLGEVKFGMQPPDLEIAARRAAASPDLELLGLHAFGDSNVLDAGRLERHASATIAAVDRLSRDLGVPLPLVDVGGGPGIPYADDEPELDVCALGRAIARASTGSVVDRVVLEPGRYLVGPAGIYLTRVLDVKPGGDTTVVIVDGGIHHLLRPALVGRFHRLRLAGPMNRPRALERVTIGGPLCTGIDLLARDVELPMPQAGELLAVLDAGAYGFTESMPLFLSHPTPAEVAIIAGRASLIRPQITPAAWLAGQLLP